MDVHDLRLGSCHDRPHEGIIQGVVTLNLFAGRRETEDNRSRGVWVSESSFLVWSGLFCCHCKIPLVASSACVLFRSTIPIARYPQSELQNWNPWR